MEVSIFEGMLYVNNADDKVRGGGSEWNTPGKAGSNGGRSANGHISYEEPRLEECLTRAATTGI